MVRQSRSVIKDLAPIQEISASKPTLGRRVHAWRIYFIFSLGAFGSEPNEGEEGRGET